MPTNEEAVLKLLRTGHK